MPPLDLNPLKGCRVAPFRAPTEEDQARDFLWRIHRHVPRRGQITVFNRSHYEDVIAARVRELVQPQQWPLRYEHINAFEKMLSEEGTTIVKFYLHITKEYQKKRLQRRFERPDKQWRFSPSDLEDCARWKKYEQAFTDALSRCSKPSAPWHIIPAVCRWYRNVVVTSVVVKLLESLDMNYPTADFDPTSIVID